MREENAPTDAAPVEVQEIARDIVAAVRAVKLYPENNPVYAQTISKTFNLLNNHLASVPEYHFGVQKAGFFSRSGRIVMGQHLTRGIAADLFAKGIREIIFSRGLSEPEFRDFLSIISLQPDELKQQGGVAPMLWEKGAVHVRITEATLDERARRAVLEDAQAEEGGADNGEREKLAAALKDRTVNVLGRTIGLSELTADPASFGRMAVDMTGGEGLSREQQEDGLLKVYREVGREVLKKSYELRGPVFTALANSILTMDAEQREGLVARRLYPEVDALMLRGRKEEGAKQVPHDLHELASARFSRAWTAPQISSLIQKACSIDPAEQPQAKGDVPLPTGLAEAVRELAEYTPGEIDALKTICESGEERDTLLSTVTVLANVMRSILEDPKREPQQDSLGSFSRIVSQLEDAHDRLVASNEYVAAATVLQALRMPAAPLYRPRLGEAIKRAAERRRIQALITIFRGLPKGAAGSQGMLSYLSLLDREATPVLLEMLAEEEDRSVRKLLVQVLKDLGRNQIALLGQKLSDERWYFVRNIVNILGESRREDAVEFLASVSYHKNFQIRQEVVRALITIGGGKAADLMVQFISDRDIDIRFMAIRGLGSLASQGDKGEKALIDFLRSRIWSRKGDLELRLEAIDSLRRIGGERARAALGKLARRRWWKRGRFHREISSAAAKAIAEIERRAAGA